MFLAACARRSSTMQQCARFDTGAARRPVFAPCNGAQDANKLGPHLIGPQSDLRISVSSRIHEFEVRSEPSQSCVPPLAQPIEASFAKPDLNAPTSGSI